MLISGVSSQEATLKYFAYSELCSLAEDKSVSAIAQRSAFFADQKYSPSLWAHFIRESLLLLGKDYQLFLRGGNSEVAAAIPSATPAPPSISIPSTPVPLLRQRIFKHSENGSPITPPGAQPFDTLKPRTGRSSNTAELPEIFRSVEVKPALVATQEFLRKSDTAKDYFGIVKQKVHEFACGIFRKYIPPAPAAHLQSWMTWCNKERLNKIIEKCLPSRELDIIVIEGEYNISRFPTAVQSSDKFDPHRYF